jgi:hypothetical protein
MVCRYVKYMIKNRFNVGTIRNASVKEKTETASNDTLLLFSCLPFATTRGHDCCGRPISSANVGSGWLGVTLSVPKPVRREICNSCLFLYISQFLYYQKGFVIWSACTDVSLVKIVASVINNIICYIISYSRITNSTRQISGEVGIAHLGKISALIQPQGSLPYLQRTHECSCPKPGIWPTALHAVSLMFCPF